MGLNMPSDLLTKVLGYTDITSEEEQFGKIIGIHAPKRRGKTLTAIMCIGYFLESFDFIKGVISNLNLTMPSNYKKPSLPLTTLKQLSSDEYRKHLINIDEIGHVQDSRMSSSFRNLFVTNILADIGKFEQILIYTSQDANQIDRRIRKNVDVIFRPSISFKTGMMKVKVIRDYDTYFRIDAFNQWRQYDVEFFFPFRQFYTWYDTKQKIEEYYITFEPKEYLEMFNKWWLDNKYNEQDIKITNGTISLWKETQGIFITQSQMKSLIEYMLRHTDLPLYRRKNK